MRAALAVATKAAAALVVVVVVAEQDKQEAQVGVSLPSAADNIRVLLRQEGQGGQQKDKIFIAVGKRL